MTQAHTPELCTAAPEDLDPLDTFLGTDAVFRLGDGGGSAIDDVRLRFTKQAVEYHRNANSAYGEYCERIGFDSTRLTCVDDLAAVPLLATGLFKRGADAVRTGAEAHDVIMTTSSGTMGTKSIVPRDDITLKRFFASVAIGKREILGVETFDRQVFNLTPATADAPDIWVSYVMAGVGVLYTTRSYVRGGALALGELIADLSEVSPREAVNIVGPPPLLMDLAKYLEARAPLVLHPFSLVIPIGGWKRREKENVDRAGFEKSLATALGFANAAPIRDSYNMVELNTVLFECSAKSKHSPPWITVLARDPRTLSVVPSGQSGLLSFLDPTPVSYPGFVLSDDFGVVTRKMACPCGITGDVVTFERRVNRVESRGCALKIQTFDQRSG